jgi:hypothetical protein
MICGLLSVGFEVISIWMLSHVGANVSVVTETDGALHLVSTAGAPRTVLIVGNSLVLHGIDVTALDSSLGLGYMARKETVVASGYEDWRYGVSSLFDRGSHPSLVVLAISPAQLSMERPPVGRTANLVWTTRNLARYAIDHRLGLTDASNLLLVHYSAFFALRDQLRQDSRKVIVPGYAAMSHDFFDTAPLTPDSTTYLPIATSRLAQMDSLCAARGVRFAYLVIPTRAPDDMRMESMVAEAGKRAGVPVLIPIPNESLPASDQLDGYHLSPAGAIAFSTRAGPVLRQTLDTDRLPFANDDREGNAGRRAAVGRTGFDDHARARDP